jgi:hypothetical protein
MEAIFRYKGKRKETVKENEEIEIYPPHCRVRFGDGMLCLAHERAGQELLCREQ